MKFDLVQHVATQDPREVNRVVCIFGRWPYVGDDYAVRLEVFEDILVGLGVSEPPVDAFATKTYHLCKPWWAQVAITRMLLHKVGRDSFCG